MRIQIKEKRILKDKKIDDYILIEDMIFYEDLVNPEKRHINLYFRGKKSSGILKIGHEEAKELVNSINAELNLVRDFKGE